MYPEGNAGELFSVTPTAPLFCIYVRHDKPVLTRSTANAVDHASFCNSGFARQRLSRRRTPFGSNCLLANGPEASSFDDAPVSHSHLTIFAPRF